MARKIRRNADDRLRRLERKRYDSLADAAAYVDENLRLGRFVFSRPFRSDFEPPYQGIADFSNGYSLWKWGGRTVDGGTMIMVNELSGAIKHTGGWIRDIARPLSAFVGPKNNALQESPLGLLRAWPYLLPGFTRDREEIQVYSEAQLLQLAQEVSSWIPIENIQAPLSRAEARSRGMTWLE